MTGHEQGRAVQAEAFSAVGEGLRTVKLAPWGEVASTHGKFLVDDQAARETIAAFDAQGAAVPIDIEHETLAGREPAGGARGAIGWIEKVFHEVGRGLFALVKWSEKGKELIRSDAFRYLSPVFLIRNDDRRVVGLHSAAVTTKPALVKAELLAASQNATETKAMAEGMDPMMMLKELAALLKIEGKDDATALLAAIRAKIKSMMGDESAAIASSVRERLGLPATANRDAVLLAMTTHGADDKAVTELAAMREAESQRVATAMVQEYVAAGKLNPNDKAAVAAATRLAMSDPGTLEAIFKNIVVQCPPGRTTPPSSRQLAIGRAEREYRSNVGHQKATSLKAFVQQAMRDSGLAPLSEDEARTLVAL